MPQQVRKWQVQRLDTDFRTACQLIQDTCPSPQANQVTVAPIWAGINASDVNFVAGRYNPGLKPPFDAGMECIGKVTDVGKDVRNVRKGDIVNVGLPGCFSDAYNVNAKGCLKVPMADPRLLTISVSGLTAALALDITGEMKAGETVLVTAAAGGTGVWACQLAKLAGCHVIGTCSTPEKVEFLKSIGVDRPINYKKERLGDVLKREYPKGVDIVYESVGGQMFEDSVDNLAVKGRCIIIGFIESYKGKSFTKGQQTIGLTPRLLMKSSSVRGFFLPQFQEHFGEYSRKLANLIMAGKIKGVVDPDCENGKFTGVASVPDAIDYMYRGGNVGKVVVKIQNESRL
eukprot:Clim_evm5s199 gene=Clim_evmTU5s199